MEQDIKILEDFINKPVKSGEFNKISNKEIQALGNMLKRYKELQKENENYKKYAVMMSTEGLLNEIDKLGDMLQETMEGKLQKYTPGEIIFLKRFLENLLEERN